MGFASAARADQTILTPADQTILRVQPEVCPIR